jgi:hypothetical protein
MIVGDIKPIGSGEHCDMYISLNGKRRDLFKERFSTPERLQKNVEVAFVSIKRVPFSQ